MNVFTARRRRRYYRCCWNKKYSKAEISYKPTHSEHMGVACVCVCVCVCVLARAMGKARRKEKQPSEHGFMTFTFTLCSGFKAMKECKCVCLCGGSHLYPLHGPELVLLQVGCKWKNHQLNINSITHTHTRRHQGLGWKRWVETGLWSCI